MLFWGDYRSLPIFVTTWPGFEISLWEIAAAIWSWRREGRVGTMAWPRAAVAVATVVAETCWEMMARLSASTPLEVLECQWQSRD